MVRCCSELLLAVVTLVACLSIASGVDNESNRERRHVGAEESSHPVYRTETTHKKHSSSKNNDITVTGPDRKVSHRLMGGHLRAGSNSKEEKVTESLWDDGILMSSAGNGKERKSSKNDEDDDKKTLSQQVKEGKYGLIQDEIYSKVPKRPGIISYLPNSDVPKDTIDNLGGLDDEDIWLAENHMLVLRGGNFPEHEAASDQNALEDNKETWPPIDDYNAPRRQVKIPKSPKVPPPFPIQLTEDGPVQIIGPNGTVSVNSTTLVDYDSPYSKGVLPGEGPFFAVNPNGSFVTAGPDNDAKSSNKNDKVSNNVARVKGGEKSPNLRPDEPTPPLYHALPPGAVFVPPPSNLTDYDDDDQSVYYPTPYSFYYQQDNTTAVPPGPLVPGIILPPPPDFFSALDEKKPSSSTKKYAKRPETTPRSRVTYLPPRKLTTKNPKSTSSSQSTTRTTIVYPVSTKSVSKITKKNVTMQPTKIYAKTSVPFIEVTTVTPEKPSTLDNTEYFTIKPVVNNRVPEITTENKDQWSNIVNGKSSPIVAYYPTTTASTLERPVQITPATIVKNIITTNAPGRVSQASYYFYEEASDDNTATTESPIYYRTTTESPFYKAEAEPVREEVRPKPYYKIESIPSRETQEAPIKDYSVKLIDTLVKDRQVYQFGDTGVTSTSNKFESSPPRSQSQRMLSDEAPIYYRQISNDPSSLPVRSYTTEQPRSFYQDTSSTRDKGYGYEEGKKPKPIYQYSFEAADYSKRGNKQHVVSYYKNRPRYEQPRQTAVYNEYQDIESGGRQYEYTDSKYERQQPLVEQRPRPEAVLYNTQRPSAYATTTLRPVGEATQNPQHAYFTQQEERLLDDVTKEYFTIFGKKLKSLPSTTPIYGKSSSVTERPNYDLNAYIPNDYNSARPILLKSPKVKVHYGDQPLRPYSLKDDTLVNFKNPLPPINPDSEFIPIVDPKQRQRPSALQSYRAPLQIQQESQLGSYGLEQNRGTQQQTPIRDYNVPGIVQDSSRAYGSSGSAGFVQLADSRDQRQQQSQQQQPYRPIRPVSLEGDIAVNYRDPRPPINPDAEFIGPLGGIGDQGRPDNKPNAYFAYSLPGDGGHFYFLTPQVTQRRDQSGGYLYAKPPRGSRFSRRKRGPANI
ncbi:uncharacterized protein [Prorops nasuta]|uniref:uncharacterized protein n=1 Tax=Prorops nasuta TaxID=863751 RepID=UPI0034CD1AE6